MSKSSNGKKPGSGAGGTGGSGTASGSGGNSGMGTESGTEAQLRVQLQTEREMLARAQAQIKLAQEAKGQAEREVSKAGEALAKAEALTQAAENRAAQAEARYAERLKALNADVEGWLAKRRVETAAALDAEIERERVARREGVEKEIAAVRAEAARLREGAHREHAQALAAIEAQLKQARDEAATLAEQSQLERRQAAAERQRAQAEAVEIRRKAEADAQAKQAQADDLQARAKAEAEDVKLKATLAAQRREHEAEQAAERAQAEAHARLIEREHALYEQTDALSQLDAELDERKREQAGKQHDLDALERALGEEQRRLDQARAQHRRDVDRLGPAAVEKLETRVQELEQRLEQAREERRAAHERVSLLEQQLDEAAGPGAQTRWAELERLRGENVRLHAELDRRPDEAETARLKEEVRRAEAAQGERHTLRQRVADLEQAQTQHDAAIRRARQEATLAESERRAEQARAEQARVEQAEAHAEALADYEETLRTQRRDLAGLEQSRHEWDTAQALLEAERVHNAELKRKLAEFTDQAREAAQEQFGLLAQIDNDDTTPPAAPPARPVNLKQLAADIRNRIAQGVGPKKQRFFYSEHTIRAFIASLACADLTLLQGPSGTGKTSLPLAVGEAMGAEVVRIPVQAGWRERADLLGNYNAFTRSFRSTPFTEAVYRAGGPGFSDRPVFIVLDECNLSQMEYYFADLLSELEDWSRQPTIQLFEEGIRGQAPRRLLDGRKLTLPRNVRYFGTANQDETTCGIADKTYDRAAVLLLEDRAQAFAPLPATRVTPMSWSALQDAFSEASQGAAAKQYSEFIGKLEKLYMDDFGFGLGNRFEERIASRFVPVYAACGGTAHDAFDHLLRSRIVRKLDRLRDPGMKKPLEKLHDLLGKLPTGRPLLSQLALEKIIQRVSR